jgi:hypothetical protein
LLFFDAILPSIVQLRLHLFVEMLVVNLIELEDFKSVSKEGI